MAARNGHKVFDRRFKMSDKLLASKQASKQGNTILMF